MPRALDPQKRTDARRLRTQGKSLTEITSELGISYGSAHRFTKGVCPEKKRSPEVRGTCQSLESDPGCWSAGRFLDGERRELLSPFSQGQHQGGRYQSGQLTAESRSEPELI